MVRVDEGEKASGADFVVVVESDGFIPAVGFSGNHPATLLQELFYGGHKQCLATAGIIAVVGDPVGKIDQHLRTASIGLIEVQ